MVYNYAKKELSKILLRILRQELKYDWCDDVKIEKTKIPEHGDYASNISMLLAKKLNEPPIVIAEKIKAKIQSDYIEKIEVKSPGFLNFFLTKSFYINAFKEVILNDGIYFRPNIGENRKLVIEYSQPNIAKPLGVHHLLSTIIGQSLVNLYEYLNFDVIKVNHIGDWGTQFGKLIYAIKKWGDKKEIDKNPIPELLKLYVFFHDQAEKMECLNDEARNEFKKLEEGDKQNIELWKWIREISLNEVKLTYSNLGGITFADQDYVGESFYNDKMADILHEGKEKGIFKLSEDAYIAETENTDPPLLVQKKDGTTLYATRDLAQVKYRSSLGIIKNIMVVDVAQSLHFRQFFHVAKKLGYTNNENGEVELKHIVFGRMTLPDRNMSTRKGNVILLDKLIEESKVRAYDLITSINSDLSEDEKKNLAEISGVGSIKYNVLSQNRIHNLTFDWNKMICMDGNSAPYLQYSYARARSILNKNTGKIGRGFDFEKNIEKELMKIILDFPDILTLAQDTNMPHHLATYIYELATTFNSFYNSVSVNKSYGNTKNFRLNLVDQISKIIKTTLEILVIDAPEKM